MFEKVVRKVVAFVAVPTCVAYMYTGFAGPYSFMQQRGVLLIVGLALIFLLFPIMKGNRRHIGLTVDILLALASIASVVYLMCEEWPLLLRAGAPNQWDIVFGTLLLVLVLEATRRTLGMPLVIITAVFLVYAYVGPYLPWILKHPGFKVTHIIYVSSISQEGLWGMPLGVVASIVIIFLIFGNLAVQFGVGNFFTSLAYSFVGRMRGGSGKLAIISSALFGMISGSSMANVVVTGQFTIPLMKRDGIKPHIAAGTEAVASCGGQLMPPIMGATAFVMADFLNVSYWSIVVAAFIPATLFYFSLYWMIDFEAAKTGLRGHPGRELPSILRTLREGSYLLIPVAALVYMIGALQWSPARAGTIAALSILVVKWVAKRPTKIDLKRVAQAFDDTIRGSLSVVIACAMAGIVMGMINLSGFGLRLSSLLITISGGYMVILLVLAMLTALVLGMGLPTVAAYLFLAILVAPTVVASGVPLLAAHLFLLYFAVLCVVTPPVAVAAYVAAPIAGTNPSLAGWSAFRFATAGFVIPYMFVYSPALIAQGNVIQIVISLVIAALAVISLAGAVQGYLLTKVRVVERILLVGGTTLLIMPALLMNGIGITVLLAVIINQWRRRRRT